MSQEKFNRLIESFCEHLGLDQPEKIIQGDPISVDSVHCSLQYNHHAFPGRLFVYIDYGTLPAGKELQATIALLQHNHRFYTGDGPSFGCSEDGKQIILSDTADVHEIDVEKLAERIETYVEHVNQWRHEFSVEGSNRAHSLENTASHDFSGLPRNLASQLQNR